MMNDNTSPMPAKPAATKRSGGKLILFLLCGVAVAALTMDAWKPYAQAQVTALKARFIAEENPSAATDVSIAEQELAAAAQENSTDTEEAASETSADPDNVAQQVQAQREEIAQLKEDLANLTNALTIPEEYAEQAKQLTALQNTVTTLKAQIADMLLREHQYTQPIKDMKAWWLVQQMQTKFTHGDFWYTLILQFLNSFNAVTPNEQEVVSRMQHWSLQPPLLPANLLVELYKAQPDLAQEQTAPKGLWEQLKEGLSKVIVIRRISEDGSDTSYLSDSEILLAAADDVRAGAIASAASQLRPLARRHESLKNWLVLADDYLQAEKDLLFLNNILIGRQVGETATAVPMATTVEPATKALPQEPLETSKQPAAETAPVDVAPKAAR